MTFTHAKCRFACNAGFFCHLTGHAFLNADGGYDDDEFEADDVLLPESKSEDGAIAAALAAGHDEEAQAQEEDELSLSNSASSSDLEAISDADSAAEAAAVANESFQNDAFDLEREASEVAGLSSAAQDSAAED